MFSTWHKKFHDTGFVWYRSMTCRHAANPAFIATSLFICLYMHTYTIYKIIYTYSVSTKFNVHNVGKMVTSFNISYSVILFQKIDFNYWSWWSIYRSAVWDSSNKGLMIPLVGQIINPSLELSLYHWGSLHYSSSVMIHLQLHF